MSSENSEILIRALEASGSEREAKLARAILGEVPAQPTAPAAPAAGDPAPAAMPAPVAAPAIPGEVAPAGVPVEVQAHAAAMAASGVPGGEVTREQLKTMDAHQIAALPKAAVAAALAEGGRS
jgi:hypothetical protein